jgi:hypothetical protein
MVWDGHKYKVIEFHNDIIVSYWVDKEYIKGDAPNTPWNVWGIGGIPGRDVVNYIKIPDIRNGY